MTDPRSRKLSTALPGDRGTLTPYRPKQIFSRTLFFTELLEASGETHAYAVDVNFYTEELSGWDPEHELGRSAADESPVALYRDGIQIFRSNLPAVFPVPGGQVEVATRIWGLRRMHYLGDNGEEHVLRPDRYSPEGLRDRFARRAPRASRMIGRIAAAVLLSSLVLTLPQAFQAFTELGLIAEHVGAFTSPIYLPDWANSTLVIAAALAAVERALTLRWNWLLDLDMSWGDSE